ncbi:oligosaccharide flippase family protein [Ottowia caeni]|uniref:oligosaccharide flippase family protein n=1 Tax=Ottowia caeni TaxID=2870339 RepID=UPI001E636FE5|nr:oligosaccharide flippase family protein [Ottowia caeni]
MTLNKIIGFALGPIAGAAFGLITVPVVAWAFSADDLGRLNILQVTQSFCLLFLVLGLDQAYVREYHESKDRASLLKACFAPGFVLLVISSILIIGFKTEVALWLFGMANPTLFWLTLASVMVSFSSRFLSLILRMQERGLAFSLSQIIPKALLLVLIGVIVWIDLPRNFSTLVWAFLASLISVAVVYIWNTRSLLRAALKSNIERERIYYLLRFGAPLIFSGLAYWGLSATSSVALRSLSTFSELGVYAVTVSIAGVAAIFQSIFTVVWAPIVYKWVAEGVDPGRIDKVGRHVLGAVCAIFLACGLFSWMAEYFLPPQYSAVKYLVLCAIAQPLLYTLSEVTCVGIGISRRTMLTVWVTLLALCANVLLCWWLVPLYGATGAVISNAVAYLVFFVARTEASAYVWRPFPRVRLYVFTTGAVALAVFTVALGPSAPIHYSIVWLALTPLIAWSFRAELKEMLTTGRVAWERRTQKAGRAI